MPPCSLPANRLLSHCNLSTTSLQVTPALIVLVALAVRPTVSSACTVTGVSGASPVSNGEQFLCPLECRTVWHPAVKVAALGVTRNSTTGCWLGPFWTREFHA